VAPHAQEDDAKRKFGEQEMAALNAVRCGWKHLLVLHEAQPGTPTSHAAFLQGRPGSQHRTPQLVAGMPQQLKNACVNREFTALQRTSKRGLCYVTQRF
jgi:hypothetical protein